ncbi:hypothetical protein ROLI_001760 [Roseobacter fucihabitans]|uniref:Uncharacterized protein n=1 Tax=Roseobacter fucihabitans TaxID=1537242 RepID=A0ABZ2BP51_9RHOB|nr:hypothetical protein [Roseobacter litoralis]
MFIAKCTIDFQKRAADLSEIKSASASMSALSMWMIIRSARGDVSNPYSRILSSFFDKICGPLRNGRRNRGNLILVLMQKCGIDVARADGQSQ